MVHISIDTDPNEDESVVKNHKQSNNFDWYFAISPVELTQALMSEFGPDIISAPSAPVVLICKDQKFRLLKRGLKKESKLKEEQKGLGMRNHGEF